MKKSLSRLNRAAVLLIVLAGIAFSAVPAVSPVTVKATLSKDKITIGDKVDFQLLIKGKGELKFLPIDPSSYFQTFEVKEHLQKGPYKSWGRTILEYRLVLTTFTTGDYVIPSILVKYTEKDGTEKEARSEELVLHVEPVKTNPDDKDDVREIKPPITLPHSFLFWLFTVILPLLALGTFFLVRHLRARNSGNILINSEPARPPHEIAYERLSKLKELKLIEQEKIKEHYYLLSEIIRGYLEARFELPIVERTTSEAYKEMVGSAKLKRKEVTLIKDFLEECDLVKFAKMLPEAKEIDSDFEKGVSIVDLTKFIPQPVVTPGMGQGGNL